jgi:hypothetical protein
MLSNNLIIVRQIGVLFLKSSLKNLNNLKLNVNSFKKNLILLNNQASYLLKSGIKEKNNSKRA